MSLKEYERKRRFDSTPEPPAKLETKSGHRFVVQMHRATRLHYDFRLELDGVLKSWAVPKGPSLDPADKRLAMEVEDHPVSYYDFEGIIPENNYGAGSVMVWDMGTWEPLSSVTVDGKYVPASDQDARTMLSKGDLKFRLNGERLKGDFALVKMRGRRPGSKGNEWLLIKKHDEHEVEDYDIDQYDSSVLTKRSMDEIAGDEGSAEWRSRPAGRGRAKAAWLSNAIAKYDKKKAAEKIQGAESVAAVEATEKPAAKPAKTKKAKKAEPIDIREASEKKNGKDNGKDKDEETEVGVAVAKEQSSLFEEQTQPGIANSDGARAPSKSTGKSRVTSSSALSAEALPAVENVPGAKRAPMPTAISPMLATAVEEPFDSPDWLFEIKWDGYRAIAFIEKDTVRLVSRNQNDLTAQYSDLGDLPQAVNAKTAILDGEVVVLDEHGRPSFSLMQQRTGFRERGRRVTPRPEVPVLYYAFDLLYLDGFDLRRVALEDRKRLLTSIVTENDALRISGHFPANGKALFEVAQQKGLEGILAKRNGSLYEERRSREWLKIKIRHQLEAVIGGYIEPEGSRQYFGSIVLGLYDEDGSFIHVGQAGSGFTQMTLASVWKLLKPLETKTNPFHGKVEALKKVHWVKPELVAQIEFTEWTHATDEGDPKLRAPVFLGLREDKDPKECVLEQ